MVPDDETGSLPPRECLREKNLVDVVVCDPECAGQAGRFQRCMVHSRRPHHTFVIA